MDAYYLKDYFYGYIEKIKKSFKIKTIVLMMVSGVALSLILAFLFGIVSALIPLPGPLTVSVLSLTLLSTTSMMLFNRKEFLCKLLDRAIFLFKNKIHYSGYIVISAFAFLSLLLCIGGYSIFVFSVALLFLLTPRILSDFSSAAFNSIFKALGRDLRIGSDHIDLLLFGAGALSVIISVVAVIVGGVL